MGNSYYRLHAKTSLHEGSLQCEWRMQGRGDWVSELPSFLHADEIINQSWVFARVLNELLLNWGSVVWINEMLIGLGLSIVFFFFWWGNVPLVISWCLKATAVHSCACVLPAQSKQAQWTRGVPQGFFLIFPHHLIIVNITSDLYSQGSLSNISSVTQTVCPGGLTFCSTWRSNSKRSHATIITQVKHTNIYNKISWSMWSREWWRFTV